MKYSPSASMALSIIVGLQSFNIPPSLMMWLSLVQTEYVRFNEAGIEKLRFQLFVPLIIFEFKLNEGSEGRVVKETCDAFYQVVLPLARSVLFLTNLHKSILLPYLLRS